MQALLTDAGNTLLQLREPVGVTYARLGRPFGVRRGPQEVDDAFRAAFAVPWTGPRYAGDGRPFWRRVVALSTGCNDPDYFERLYAHYALAEAWALAPGALACFGRLRARGVKVAVVSNWDTRLRGLLDEIGALAALDEAVISAEVGVEKPDPEIYRLACRRLGVAPEQALHVGDHPRKDVAAARAAGCRARLWSELGGFEAVESLYSPSPNSR